MKIKTLILLLFLLSHIGLWAQGRYKHHYPFKTNSVAPRYQLLVDDTLTNSPLTEIHFSIHDTSGDEGAFLQIKIDGIVSDTTLIADQHGKAKLILRPDTIDVTVFSIDLIPLHINDLALRHHSSYSVKMVMGVTIMYGNLYCRKKLSEEEKQKMIDDISTFQKERPTLGKRKCFVTWDI